MRRVLLAAEISEDTGFRRNVDGIVLRSSYFGMLAKCLVTDRYFKRLLRAKFRRSKRTGELLRNKARRVLREMRENWAGPAPRRPPWTGGVAHA